MFVLDLPLSLFNGRTQDRIPHGRLETNEQIVAPRFGIIGNAKHAVTQLTRISLRGTARHYLDDH